MNLTDEDLVHARRYFESNYHGSYVAGNGLEVVYELLRNITVNGPWIDLAAGPFSAVWALALVRATELLAIDRSAAGLWLGDTTWHDFLDSTFVDQLIEFELVPEGGRMAAHDLSRRYVKADLLDGLPADLTRGGTSIVTAMGFFGFVPTVADGIGVLRRVQKVLSLDGSLVCATWIRHGSAEASLGLFKSWPNELIRASGSASLEVKIAKVVELESDPEFSRMYAWLASPMIDIRRRGFA